MTADDRRPRGFLRLAILATGVHSCALGGIMLVMPRTFAALMGFTPNDDAFFPSQGGVFLVVLGICYLLALRDRALIATILVSKALAVVFLVTHAALLDAPQMVWLAAAGDAGMLAATILGIRIARGRNLPVAAGSTRLGDA